MPWIDSSKERVRGRVGEGVKTESTRYPVPSAQEKRCIGVLAKVHDRHSGNRKRYNAIIRNPNSRDVKPVLTGIKGMKGIGKIGTLIMDLPLRPPRPLR